MITVCREFRRSRNRLEFYGDPDTGDGAAARARRQARVPEAYFERVRFAVERSRREADHVLTVQFLRDAGERRAQRVVVTQFEVAAAGFLRVLPQVTVGPAAHHARAIKIFRSEANGVNHYLFSDRAIKHVVGISVAARVVAVGEHEDHTSSFDLP